MKQNRSLREGLPTVLCECGEELLVIPDLDEMAHCIKTHAIFHKKKEADPMKAQNEQCRIEEQLVRKIIIKIADMPNNSI